MEFAQSKFLNYCYYYYGSFEEQCLWYNESVRKQRLFLLFVFVCFRCGLKTEEPNVGSLTKRRKTNGNSRRNRHRGQFLHQNSTNQRNQVLLRTSSQAAVQTWTTCGTVHLQLLWHTVKTTPPLPCWQTIPAQCLCLPHTLPLRRHPRLTTDKMRTVRTCRRLTCIWTDRANKRIRQPICNQKNDVSRQAMYILPKWSHIMREQSLRKEPNNRVSGEDGRRRPNAIERTSDKHTDQRKFLWIRTKLLEKMFLCFARKDFFTLDRICCTYDKFNYMSFISSRGARSEL